MIYTFLKKSTILFIGVFLFFLGCTTTWATGFQIDSTNYPTYLATQEGDFTLE